MQKKIYCILTVFLCSTNALRSDHDQAHLGYLGSILTSDPKSTSHHQSTSDYESLIAELDKEINRIKIALFLKDSIRLTQDEEKRRMEEFVEWCPDTVRSCMSGFCSRNPGVLRYRSELEKLAKFTHCLQELKKSDDLQTTIARLCAELSPHPPLPKYDEATLEQIMRAELILAGRNNPAPLDMDYHIILFHTYTFDLSDSIQNDLIKFCKRYRIDVRSTMIMQELGRLGGLISKSRIKSIATHLSKSDNRIARFHGEIITASGRCDPDLEYDYEYLLKKDHPFWPNWVIEAVVEFCERYQINFYAPGVRDLLRALGNEMRWGRNVDDDDRSTEAPDDDIESGDESDYEW